MFVRLAKYLVRFRWIILPIVAAVTFAAAAIAPRVRFDFTPQAIFAGHGDLVTYSEEFKETFGYEDAVLVVVPAFNLNFLGHESPNGLMLTPVVSDSRFDWTTGTSYPAAEVFDALRPLAQKHTGEPG